MLASLPAQSRGCRIRSVIAGYTSYVTRHTSHVTRHTSHVARHTSHVTRRTSHVTRHLPPGAPSQPLSPVARGRVCRQRHSHHHTDDECTVKSCKVLHKHSGGSRWGQVGNLVSNGRMGMRDLKNKGNSRGKKPRGRRRKGCTAPP
jgi:hypothetical protein